MLKELSKLIELLNNPIILEAKVIPWGSPIPTFGNIKNARIATLGLNPSNLEFVDDSGIELSGNKRRFHTLNSLGLKKWSDVNHENLNSIMELCNNYFSRNPYDGWFKRLDKIISGTGISYYFPSGQACHLDLIPFATECKWSELTLYQKNILLNLTGDFLGLLLNESSIELLILNGQTVVENFIKISNVEFKKTLNLFWSLPRKNNDVAGYSYSGIVTKIGGNNLNREILVLGYNHNIQSSYGVTSEIQISIGKWITEKSKQVFYETI